METDNRPAESVDDVQYRQRSIGKEIRRFYDGTVAEAVPQQLLDLLHQLDTQTEKR